MSLISDALKKAQRQRTLEVPSTGTGVERIVVRRGSTPAAKQVIVIAGAVVLAVVAAAVAAVVFLRPNAEEIAAQVALATAKSKPAPAANNTAGAATDHLIPTPVAGGARPAEPVPTIMLKVPVPPTAPPPARPEPATAANPARTVPSAAIQDFIDALKVTAVAVRDVSADSKVMMNDMKVYRLNDVVDRALGLKLTGITTDVLTFADERGTTYTKRL